MGKMSNYHPEEFMAEDEKNGHYVFDQELAEQIDSSYDEQFELDYDMDFE